MYVEICSNNRCVHTDLSTYVQLSVYLLYKYFFLHIYKGDDPEIITSYIFADCYNHSQISVCVYSFLVPFTLSPHICKMLVVIVYYSRLIS